jgi:hypothetical protein
MSRARAHVVHRGAGRLTEDDAPGITKLPTPRKKLIELCAAQYGLRFEPRVDGEPWVGWVLVDGEQWLASRRRAMEAAGLAPEPEPDAAMREAAAMRRLAAFVAECPQGRLATGGDSRTQTKRRFGLSKETIRAQARSVGLVVHENAECGVFTLLSTVNRPERWALFSEAEDLARLAPATTEAPAPSGAVEPAPSCLEALAAALAPAPTPRAEEELFSYVRAEALLDSGSTGARLAALQAAGVLTGVEAEQAARLARVDVLRATGIPPPPPTRLDALRAAGIPPPPSPPPPPPQPRQSVELPGFAPARFRSNSPLHDGDAAALRERSAADDRAEAGLE